MHSPQTNLTETNALASSTVNSDIPSQQAWIDSPRADLYWILSPAWFASLLALILAWFYGGGTDLPPWGWLLLVVGVDVAHVYSTLYRVYFDKQAFHERKNLYIFIPIACWFTGIGLHAIDKMWFWCVLAYLAVFHFVRQQYGFMRIYSRKEIFVSRLARQIDQLAIYSATLYPILYWHTHPRNFYWFLKGDFILGLPPIIHNLALIIYLIGIIAYISKETYYGLKYRYFNIPKNLLIVGTYLAWYIGIVTFNGDLAFTLTNVLAHGIPYMALVWFYHIRKRLNLQGSALKNKQRLRATLAGFVLLLCGIAFVEEAIWDWFVWKEHPQFFGNWANHFNLPTEVLSVIVPLLALPQATHYVLDAFIWKLKGKHENWKHHTLK